MLIITCLLLLTLGGLGIALIGSIKLDLQKTLQISETQVGHLIGTFGLVTIPTILLAGLLADSLGRGPVAAVGLFTFGFGLWLLGRASHYKTALSAIVLIGIGWALKANVANPLMIQTLTPFTDGDTTLASNLGNFIFGVGAFLTPLTYTFLGAKLGYRPILKTLGIFTMISTIFPVFAQIQQNPATATDGSFWTLLTNPAVWLCAGALFLYGPMEACISGWGTTITKEAGVSETNSNRLLSGYWLVYTLCRLTTALFFGHLILKIFPRGNLNALIVGIFSISLLIGLTALMNKNPKICALGLLLCGFSLAPIFPTFFAVLFNETPAAYHGAATGIFFAVGNIGWTTLPRIVGAKAKKEGIHNAFRLVFFGAILMLGISGLIQWLF